MRHTFTIPLILATALVAGALISGALIAARPQDDGNAARTYTPFIHSGALIAREDGVLIVTGTYPGSPKDAAPMAIRYGAGTVFERHDPMVEDGAWTGVTVTGTRPEDLDPGDYLYVTYVYDSENRYLATDVIVGNPLIQ
jgi:hypothetical protein